MKIYTFRPAALLGALAFLVFPAELFAQWGGEFRAQMGLGGDPIAGVQYSDGSDSDLKLGTYFSVTAGPSFDLWSSEDAALELQAMIGWAGWSTGPENTEDRLTLNRFPAELLLFYRPHVRGNGQGNPSRRRCDPPSSTGRHRIGKSRQFRVGRGRRHGPGR